MNDRQWDTVLSLVNDSLKETTISAVESSNRRQRLPELILVELEALCYALTVLTGGDPGKANNACEAISNQIFQRVTKYGEELRKHVEEQGNAKT